MTAMTPEQARDTAAIAAYGAWTGESLEQVLSDWARMPESGRVDFRAIADAVRMTIEAQSLDNAPQPAPELAAATGEAGKVRAVVRELIGMFHGIPGGYGARTSVGRLSRLAREAGVEPPLPGQPLSAVAADELGVLQDHIGTLAAGLKLSASSSRPSKKSEIETSVADALLALLDPR